MINISIDSRELSRFFNNIDRFSKDKQEAVKKEVARATYSVQNQAKLNAPVKKSFLRNHIDATIKNGSLTGEVIVKVNYGIFVHEGTKPHIILPLRAKVLAWKYGKGMKFAKRVNHPGTKANPFLSKAVNKERPIYQKNLLNIFK